MNAMRLGFVAALSCVTVAACSIGAPERASNIQNLNAIPDDISAVGMTESDSLKIPDPNLSTTLPRTYQLPSD
jgi:hypothetical protein